MDKKNVLIVLIACMLLVVGCATTNLPVKTRIITDGEVTPESKENPAYELLRSAEDYYAKGVVHNMKREWGRATEDFDEALRLIAKLDVTDNLDLSALTDMLLREIAYDYRFALVHVDSLDATSAPILLSVALEDRALSDDTKQRLSELAGDLPKAISGEFDFPVVWNDRVKEKIVFLQTDAREPFSEWLRRSGRYLPMIEEVFSTYDLPMDLCYLPLIESGFAPNAYSWAHAVGLWQFVKSTGRIFGLQVNWWLDERRDPEKATIAAAEYFTSLYKKFGDWEICLAAYNSGDGRLKRSIRDQETSNYWELDLPNETENYVPLFIAALIIAKNPEAYGFEIEPYDPYITDLITVDEPTNLKLVAQCTDTSLSFIRELNPEIIRYCTPPDVTSYPLRVPCGSGEAFHERYAAIPDNEKTIWARHVVQKGETLSEIALHYGTSLQGLVSANDLSNAHRLSIGQELVIPVTPGEASALNGTITEASTSYSGSSNINRYHKVKKGDTLSEIADKYSVSLDELIIANSLESGSVIKPGLRLKIPLGSSKITYRVQSGDTPSQIAARYGVRTADVLSWNNLKSSTTIYPGQELTLLVNENQKKPRGKIIHTVQNGESLWAIARRYDVHVSDIISWNGLSSKNVVLQIGQKLTVLSDQEGSSGGYKASNRKIVYNVVKGDNLHGIAQKYDVTVEAIQRWNDKDDTRLQIGDKLVVYTSSESASSNTNDKLVKHRVKSGETLGHIAEKYGATVSDIRKWNGKSGNKIIIGEELKVYTSASTANKSFTHTVKPGETLSSISMKYKASVSDIKKWNNKKSDAIRIGEELEIHGEKEYSSQIDYSEERTIKHTVKAGENLSELAVKYSVEAKDIKNWNDKSDDNLYIGEVLTIHCKQTQGGFGGGTGSTIVTHTVKKGETLWGIARKYGTTTEAILYNNANLDPQKLKVGDILKVKIEN